MIIDQKITYHYKTNTVYMIIYEIKSVIEIMHENIE